jgi:Uma2 family endonuclease
VEIVSEGKDARERDLITKRKEYAKAGVQEYWIVDPQLRQITILVLEGQTYREHGVFASGATAASVMLPGFSLSVDAVFAAGPRVSK